MKIFIFSLFLLLTPLFLNAGNNTNVNLGPQVYGDSEIPVILPRATWENSSDLIKLFDWYPEEISSKQAEGEKENSPPDYFSIDRIIIHDMGCDVKYSGCNNKEINPITLIQNIYRYQAVTRGWGDIGYHYIIDYWGNIYEGRYGGNGVRGAHTYYDKQCNNFNIGSVSILLMGNYEKVEPSEVMYESLIRLIAWVADTNGLDPAELNHFSEIWHSPLKDSGCDISQGGFTSAYIGPVVIGHKDIEGGNSDPGLLNFEKIRQEADKLLLKYKNYVYTTGNDSKIYAIENGIKKELSSQGELSSLKVVLNKNQLETFSSSIIKIYPDNALVKSYTRDRVYLIEQNKRRPIFSEKLFNLKKFKWSVINLLPDRELAIYSLGAPLTYPDGSLIKGDGPEIYLVENNKRRHITSMALFKKIGFKKSNVIEINQAELLAHPLGEEILLADNSLIKEEKHPQIYLVKNKKRHWIKTQQTFSNLGYKWKDVITFSSDEINHYVIGSMINVVSDVAKLELEEVAETSEITGPVESPSSIQMDRESDIRIGIYNVLPGENVKIRANGPYEVYKNGILLASKKTNESINILYSKTDFYRFEPLNKNVIFEIISYEDHPKWNPKINDNRFQGIIEIKYSTKSNKAWVINELPLEDYLKGVAEALDSDPIEYLKSFIIAARSYSLFHIQNGGKVTGEIFHLRNWAFDQLYKGYGFEERAANIVEAVEETRGMVAMFNNKPIRGVYSSDSGGITKDACEVFKAEFCSSGDYDYLKGGVKDPEGTIHSKEAILVSHGVGMSSAGARRLAKTGKSFEEILKYYYLGIEIKKMY